MKNRVIIIFDHDIVGYPPTLSLINILLDIGKEVVFIGQYSDIEGMSKLEQKGCIFIELESSPRFNIKNGLIRKLNILYHLYDYKRKFFKIIDNFSFQNNDLIWFIFSEKALFSFNFLSHHNYVVQFYEFVDVNFGGKYKLFFPKYDPNKILSNASNVIHCEYNRAAIMNGLYCITGKYNILPNKPYVTEQSIDNTPREIESLYDIVKKKISNRKSILYLGMFNSDERRLEEFCDAIDVLPNDYVFIAMGGGKYWEELKLKYTSDKFIFIPFVKPPYHLLFVQLASVGILSYLPVSKSIHDVINPIYCAPNKIFEYTKYNKPIICNDIPALRSIIEKYQCGSIVESPITPDGIVKAIKHIFTNYSEMQTQSKVFYNSINIKEIVLDILNRSEHLSQ